MQHYILTSIILNFYKTLLALLLGMSYRDDDDLQGPSKKPRLEFRNDLESNKILFEETLNKIPRPVQLQLLNYIHQNVKDKTKFAIDLPTGGGKSALAGFGGIVACKCYDCTRIVYITSSKTLQKQVVLDAAQWKLEKSVVCQFGKSNYYCPKRLARLMNAKADESNSLINLMNGSPKLARKAFDILNKMRSINIKTLDMTDDFYTTSYREKFKDVMIQEEIPEENINAVWDEISANGGCEKKDTKCSCRKDLKIHFNKETHKDLNSFLLKHLDCPWCRVRILSKMCGFLVTNMDAIFSFLQHAGLEYIIEPNDFVIFDEAHNICKRAQELFDGKTQRKFSVSNVSEQLKKWSKMNVDFCTGKFEGQTFFNFPEDDRAVLTFDNNQYTPYYGLVYKELMQIELNEKYNKSMREKVIKDIEEILSSYNEEETRFEEALNVLDLKNVVGHICNVMNVPDDIKETILQETCKERQKLLGDSEKEDVTNNRNKANYFLQAEIANIYCSKKNVDENEHKFIEECHKLYKKNGEETLEHLYNTVKETHKYMTDIEVAKKAICKNEWLNDKELYKKFIPKISKDGFSYDMTFMEKAEVLYKNLWEKLNQSVMFMSATISNPEKDEEYSFEDFFCETGLPSSTVCNTTKEVFDSKRLTIYVPSMKKYSYSADLSYKREYNNERIRHMTKMIKMNPLATLVLSNNVEDYKSVIYAMKKTMKSHKHVDYNQELGLFKEFELGEKNNFVIYGSEKLWTGLNLPGRIGLVIILKPFNRFRQVEGSYYSSIFKKYFTETNMNSIEMFNSLYRYNTCRDTIQACGRIMRKEDDSGVVMFLSDNKKDSEMLKNKYKNSPYILGKEISVWPAFK